MAELESSIEVREFGEVLGFTSALIHCAMRSMMQFRIFCLLAMLLAFVSGSFIQAANNPALQKQLDGVYNQWRQAVINKDAAAWSRLTAKNRQLAVRNRIYSEKRQFPKAVFDLPAAPPSISGLKGLSAHRKGATATAVYFGKVDFGVGGKPTDNLLLLHFVNDAGRWRYDTADYISLQSLPEVRKQLQSGDLSYVEQKDFQASGIVPQMPIPVKPAQFIAKVYVFSPGREVKVKVNKISDHRFQDNKAAEVVIGGAKMGANEVQFATKSLEGSTGQEALSVRVYLLSTVPGVKPIKVYEYQINEGEEVKPFGSGSFVIDAKVANQLKGKK
jgi:hypothetical protein